MGASHARLLVAEGASVVIGDILDDEGAALASDLGDAARYAHLDVTKPSDWAAAVAMAVEQFEKLDVLVNNAGIINYGPLKTFDLTKWQRVLDVTSTSRPSRACGALRGCTGT
jgi:3alpha(or 20beta)-hydroxysteroid dehydrogenase